MAGVSPTVASIKPKRARSLARIRSQASASSKPQVRHRPCAAKTVGQGSAATRCATETKPANRADGLIGIAERVEQMDIDAPRDHLALEPEQHPSGRGPLQLPDRRDQRVPHHRVEQVQRRRIDGHNRETAIAGDRHRNSSVHHCRCPGRAGLSGAGRRGPILLLVLVVRAQTLITIFTSAINATDLPWRMRPTLRAGESRRCVRPSHIPGSTCVLARDRAAGGHRLN